MTSIRSQKLNAASLKFLVRGFLLTKQQEARSPRTVEDYSENLERFLWYAERQGWSDNVREISQWHIREFLGYVANEMNRWDSDTLPARCPASQSTVHHYYRILRSFFNWIVTEGFMGQSPVAKVKVVSPKPKVIQPYSPEEVKAMVKVCDYDYANGRQFLGARNKAIVLILYDTGVRLSELANMNLEDINEANGWIRVLGKGGKERPAGIEGTAQRALWRYLVHRPENEHRGLWLTEEGKPLTKWGCIRVAQYTRLRFYHQKKRWRRVFSVSLNSVVRDEDGNETQFINTLVDQKGVNLDALIDAKSHYLSSPEKTRQAIRKLLNNGDGNGHRLSGNDWKLIRQFREEFKALA